VACKWTKTVEKAAKKCVNVCYFCHFQKMSKVNIRPMGEKSPKSGHPPTYIFCVPQFPLAAKAVKMFQSQHSPSYRYLHTYLDL
jgi:hypothetical protein